MILCRSRCARVRATLPDHMCLSVSRVWESFVSGRIFYSIVVRTKTDFLFTQNCVFVRHFNVVRVKFKRNWFSSHKTRHQFLLITFSLSRCVYNRKNFVFFFRVFLRTSLRCKKEYNQRFRTKNPFESVENFQLDFMDNYKKKASGKIEVLFVWCCVYERISRITFDEKRQSILTETRKKQIKTFV